MRRPNVLWTPTNAPARLAILDLGARRRRDGAVVRFGSAHLRSTRLKRRDVPLPGAGDVVTRDGKGNKTRMVPVLQNVLALIQDYVAMCPHPLPPEGPIFVGARGGPLSPRIIQLTMERLRGALGVPDSATRMRCGILSRPTCSRVRRSARDPGVARPCLALDHADPYTGIDTERLLEVYKTAHPRA